ncbi:hypothetical protein BC748_2629 [Flavobacterium dankookense]|uniref:Uncharacterized protein n=2 Tax=Flavobacterium dankookense TaxID=706186 RepID=A0A4V3CRR6_9FLAO|nr:hypothetical protein BC748_2629 [Flavobacterium dankookense]
MSNLSNNRMNITATTTQITAVKTALQTINTNLPFLTGLTIEERIALPAIDVNNKAFTEDAIHAGVNNVQLIPSYVSVPSIQNDMTLFTQLDEIIILVKQLLEKLEDTQLLAGSEAYTSALALYKLFSSAADAGVPGADAIHNQLKQRFAGQGGPGKPATDPNS